MENNLQSRENIDLKGIENSHEVSEDKLQGANSTEPTEVTEKPTEPVEKTFTQTELNEIINKRISKANDKHSKELQKMQEQYQEDINLQHLKYKALEDEFKAYKLDIEFNKEQSQLKRLGISKEAIQSLKAIKLLGDDKTYETLRGALVAQCLKGTTPKVGTTQTKVNTKKISFLD